MSINLHVKIKGRRSLKIWQTPTYITYMCCIDEHGTIQNNLKENNARRALHCYLEWCKTLSGLWTGEEYSKRKIAIEKHCQDIYELMKYKSLEVWWM